MKRSLIILLSALIFCTTAGLAFADSNLNSAIKLYKSGNYAQAYPALTNIVAKEPSNVLAHYYLAMAAAQVGKKDEAIENYSKVITLSDNTYLTRYAMKGMTCLESPDLCNKEEAVDESDLDRFIRRQYWNGFSEQVMGDYDRQKIEELRRMMNRGEDIPLRKFKEYKDFSSSIPTETEIADALDTLERAGISNSMFGNNLYPSDLALLNYSNGESNMLNSMLLNNGARLDSQTIQSLMMNQMTLGF